MPRYCYWTYHALLSAPSSYSPRKNTGHQAFFCQKEIARYLKALKASCLDLRQLREGLSAKGVQEGIGILEAQEQMLKDALLRDHVIEQIESKQLRAETLFCDTIQKLEQQLRPSSSSESDAYTDLEDVANRVLRHLRNTKSLKWSDLPHGAVIYAKELSPSQTIEALDAAPVAFLTERGGPMSHSAIVAKAAGIPYITHLPAHAFSQEEGSCALSMHRGEG